MNKATIITSGKNWIESIAVTQLNTIANLDGVIKAVGLPDLHAGKTPIGIAVVTNKIIYPTLIGNDIGCGMGLFGTGIDMKRLKLERWQTKLNQIRELADVETHHPFGEESPIIDLGTIGSGNHFAEFQVLEKVYDNMEFEKTGLQKNDIQLLIHCGSRGYGQQIFRQFSAPQGYQSDSGEAAEYLGLHDDAVLWAKRNRFVVASKLVDALGFNSDVQELVDCKHNFMEQRGELFIHRKGAVSSKNGLVLIPGSRGTLTYLVKPCENTEISLDSISHGAGRKWARSLCKSRIKEKYDRDTIRETKLKSRVVCHDTDLLFEEAPEAYKNIDGIIDSLLEYRLIEIVATLRPVLTYKG